MPTDIFPNIDIPVITVVYDYRGLQAQEMEQRITTFNEFIMSTVNDVKSIDSQTIRGYAVLMIYFQPQVHIDAAIAQVGAAVQSIRFRFPPGVNPPWVLRFSASTVPIYQLALSSDTLSQSELYDYGIFRIRQKISVVPGTLLSAPHGGVVRQIMVDLNQQQLQAKGLTPMDIESAMTQSGRDHAHRHDQDRRPRVRFEPEQQPGRCAGVEQCAGQGGGQLGHLHARRGACARWLDGAEQRRARPMASRRC